MAPDDPLSVRRATGVLLILSTVMILIGVILYWVRQLGGGTATPVGFFWERGSIAAGALVGVLGFTLLESILSREGVSVLARPGIVLIGIGAVCILLREAGAIQGTGWLPGSEELYMVLTMLGQAAFGAAVLRRGLLSKGAGWFTILWNLAWLVILPLTSPQDWYIPGVHMFAPLVIGIGLLL